MTRDSERGVSETSVEKKQTRIKAQKRNDPGDPKENEVYRLREKSRDARPRRADGNGARPPNANNPLVG